MNTDTINGFADSSSNFDPTGAWTSHQLADTFQLGQWLGEHLTGGEIILLDGPLGAGKSIFAKGLGAALGLDFNDVTSPSFTLVNRHDGGRLTLYHLDLYRLVDGHAAAHAVDLHGLLADEQAVIVIEWAERLGSYRLPPAWRVSIKGDGAEVRHLDIARA